MTEKEGDLWAVFDKNAAPGSPRYHQTRENGKLWALKSDEPTFMPKEEAVIFLRDPAFVVVDNADQRVPSLPEQASRPQDRGGITLAQGEVVARVEELTYDALLARAAQRPGFAALGRKPKRDDLVELLRAPPPKPDAPRSESASTLRDADDIMSGDDAEAAPAEVVDKMLGANMPNMLERALQGR